MVVFQMLALLIVIAFCSIAVLAADANDTQSRTDAIVPGAFIVEFEDADDTDSLYTSLRTDGFEVEHRLSLSFSLFKGVSFQLKDFDHDESPTSAIAARRNVKNVWPVRIVSLPRNQVVSTGSNSAIGVTSPKTASNMEEEAYEPHVMTQVDRLQAEGFTGSGIRIGVVDSGVDYTHPALGGCFGTGCLVSYGYDFVGDEYTGRNLPAPDDDPMDACYGHGTHVSGIIAAQPNPLGFTGAAPNATLGQYRVFGCGGSSTNDILIAAFNQAYEDGSDIISCSAGFESGWSGDPWAVTAQRIVEAGVPVIVAAGNSGEEGLFSASSPASGKGVVSVASVDTHMTPQVLLGGTYSVNNGSSQEFGWLAGIPPFANVSLPLYATSNDTTSDDDACNPLPDDTPDLSEYMVLVRESSCRDFTQLPNLIARGGQHIMFYSQTNSTVSFWGGDQVKGVGTVTAAQGAQWVQALNAGDKVIVSVSEPASSPPLNFPVPNTLSPGFLSFFTSWGPTWELATNPQVAAPGSEILSTYPLAMGGYAVLQGTSMACPLAAAIFALVGQARGTTDPKALRNAIVTTSRPNLWHDGELAFDRLAPVAQQGAGLAQAYDAAMSKTVLDVGEFAFNDSAQFDGERKFTISNGDSKEVTYKLGHVPATTMDVFQENSEGPAQFPNPVREAWADIAFSSTSITVPAGAKSTVSLTLHPPQGLNPQNLPVYSGYVTLNGTNGDALSIPYLGVVGSLYAAKPLNTEDLFGTGLSRSTDRYRQPVPANTTFAVPAPTNTTDPANPDAHVTWPQINVLLDVGTARLRVDLVAVGATPLPIQPFFGWASVGQLWAFPVPWSPRGFYSVKFAGILADGSAVPEGTYRVVVSALKIFGDGELKDDHDWVELVPFHLKYT